MPVINTPLLPPPLRPAPQANESRSQRGFKDAMDKLPSTVSDTAKA